MSLESGLKFPTAAEPKTSRSLTWWRRQISASSSECCEIRGSWWGWARDSPSAPGTPCCRFAPASPSLCEGDGAPFVLRTFPPHSGCKRAVRPPRASPALASLRVPFAPRKGRATARVAPTCYWGSRLESWLGKAKVWVWPPVWMKIMGVFGSRFRVRIWAIRADMDLPV